jgi:hypothetical protein
MTLDDDCDNSRIRTARFWIRRYVVLQNGSSGRKHYSCPFAFSEFLFAFLTVGIQQSSRKHARGRCQ